MKTKIKILLSLLILLIVLTSISYAYDTTLATQQVGFMSSLASGEFFTPHRYYSIGYDAIFFQLEKAGTVDFELAACPGTTAGISCFYYNQSGTTLTPTIFISSANIQNCSQSVFNWSTVRATFTSNTGLISCSRGGGTNGFFISPENTYITFTATDYSLRSYTAGSGYPTYLINKYKPIGSTYIIKDGIPGADFTFPATYGDSYLNLTTFTPSCSEATGIYSYVLLNQNDSDSSQSQVTAWYANITGITPLNFTLTNPGTTTIISIGGVANFSVAANNPAAVDYVTWYIDGGLVQASATNYTLSYQFTSQGTYLVEAQLEDNTCGRYPTANFTVEVGKTITIQGTAKTQSGNPIENAHIGLIDISGVLIDEDYTDSLGAYVFAGLSENNYSLVYSATGYKTWFTNSVYYSYGTFQETTYIVNLVLNRTTETGGVQIQALDTGTGGYLTDYTLTINKGTIQTGLITIIGIRNGVVTYNISGLVTDAGNPTTITSLPAGEQYTALLSKSGYDSGGISDNLVEWTQTTTTEQFTLNLTQIQNYTENTTDFYVNFTDIQPADGATINASLTPSIIVNATITTSQDDYFTICFAYQRSGYAAVKSCLPYTVTGVIDYGYQIPNLIPGTTYYYEITAGQNYSLFSSWQREFTTTGTFIPTSTSIIITTSTIATTTTTTLNPYCVITCNANVTICHDACIDAYYNHGCSDAYLIGCGQACGAPPCFNFTSNYTHNHTEKTYDCSNLTGKMVAGDWFHPAACAYVMPLGVDWTYGLTLLLICLFLYKVTGTWVAPGIISLIISSLFYAYLPQPTLWYIGIGVGIGVGMLIYGFYKETKVENEAKELYNIYNERFR
jgi:hypothetical protein